MKRAIASIAFTVIFTILLAGCPDPETEGEPEGEALPYNCGIDADELWTYEGEPEEGGEPALDVESALEQEVFEEVNEERRQRGIAELEMDPCVWYAAQLHSRDLAYNDYCEHVNLDGEGIGDRLDMQSIPWVKCAEVLCCKIFNNDLENVVVDRWLNSAEHNESILNPLYTHAGVGVARDTLGNFYFTEILVSF